MQNINILYVNNFVYWVKNIPQNIPCWESFNMSMYLSICLFQGGENYTFKKVKLYNNKLKKIILLNIYITLYCEE
jgi:hypothetical protein